VEAPIRPLIDELGFIKDKRTLGLYVPPGLFEIPREDLERIRRALTTTR
jgi:hypothetical protein